MPLSTATAYSNAVKTTQFAIDRAFCETFYASATGYSASISNLAVISFANDNVFGDGHVGATVGVYAHAYGLYLRRLYWQHDARPSAQMAYPNKALAH